MHKSLAYEPGDPAFVLNERLSISHESDWVREYLDELKAIGSLEDIRSLVTKWSGLIPECSTLLSVTEEELPALKLFIESPEVGVNQEWLNSRVPPSTLGLVAAAKHFGVTTGVVFLQLLDHECFDVQEDSEGRVLRLRLRRKEPKPEDKDGAPRCYLQG